MIRVALIDDHELVRTGYRLILSAQPDIEIVGEAEDGQAGLQLLKRLEPDVALVDVQMPGLNGIEVTDRARRSNLRTRIVIVSMVSESPFPRRLLAAGASGYVTKGCAAAELVKAIRAVADGRRYLAASVAERLALDALDGNAGSPFEALTTRELEVAMMLSTLAHDPVEPACDSVADAAMPPDNCQRNPPLNTLVASMTRQSEPLPASGPRGNRGAPSSAERLTKANRRPSGLAHKGIAGPVDVVALSSDEPPEDSSCSTSG